MVERCEHLGFAPESGKAIGIEREAFGENLERDVAIQPGVVGLIHLAHPASADLHAEHIHAEPDAGRQHHETCVELYEADSVKSEITAS